MSRVERDFEIPQIDLRSTENPTSYGPPVLQAWSHHRALNLDLISDELGAQAPLTVRTTPIPGCSGGIVRGLSCPGASGEVFKLTKTAVPPRRLSDAIRSHNGKKLRGRPSVCDGFITLPLSNWREAPLWQSPDLGPQLNEVSFRPKA